MRFRLPRLRRRGSTMPAHPGGDDSVMVRLSPGRHLSRVGNGRMRCSTCGQATAEGASHVDAMDWAVLHHCNPDRHSLTLATNIADTDDWLTRRGYTWEPASDDVNDGLRITSPGKPDVLAPMGCVLVWDGETITVEEV